VLTDAQLKVLCREPDARGGREEAARLAWKNRDRPVVRNAAAIYQLRSRWGGYRNWRRSELG
jgi:hypothetical protein